MKRRLDDAGRDGVDADVRGEFGGKAPRDAVERAKKLLRDTAEPVAAVAARMGFDDVVYFNRFFRKLAGTTPGAFRRSG